MYSPASSREMSELIGEAEGRNAIDNAEIDGLGAAAHRAACPAIGTPNISLRRHGVDVEFFGKGLRSCGISATWARTRSSIWL